MRLAQAVLCGLPLIGVWLVVTPSSQPARPRSGERSRTARSDTIPLWRFQATSDITGFILGPERPAVLYVLPQNGPAPPAEQDPKSTSLHSHPSQNSYALFC